MELSDLKETAPWEWPRGTDKSLLAVLRNPKASAADRMLAAELSGECCVTNDSLAKVLLGIVENGAEPAELRGRAALSLGPVLEECDMDEFDDPESLPISEEVFDQIRLSLHKVFSDAGVPKLTRRQVLEASVRAPEDWHTAAIQEAYASGDAEWKLTAVFAMRYVEGFDAEIVEELNSTDELVLFHAVSAAGNWEIDDAWDRVAELVDSKKTPKDVRLAAIDAIAEIRPEEAQERLVELAEDRDEDIAAAASEAMAMAESRLECEASVFGDEDEEFDEDDEEDEDEKGH